MNPLERPREGVPAPPQESHHRRAPLARHTIYREAERMSDGCDAKDKKIARLKRRLVALEAEAQRQRKRDGVDASSCGWCNGSGNFRTTSGKLEICRMCHGRGYF